MDGIFWGHSLFASFIGAIRFGKGSERQKSLRRKSKKNIESQKVHRKFEKDQNVKSQIRLSMFWTFLTP